MVTMAASQAMEEPEAAPSPTSMAEALARLLTRFAEQRHRSAQCGVPWAATETAHQGRRRLHAAARLPGGVLAVTPSEPQGDGQQEDFSAVQQLLALGGERGDRASAARGWGAHTAAEVAQWAQGNAEWLASCAAGEHAHPGTGL